MLQSHRTVPVEPLKGICPRPCGTPTAPSHAQIPSPDLGAPPPIWYLLTMLHCLHCVCSTMHPKNQHCLSPGREDGDCDMKSSVAPESNLCDQNALFQHKNNSTRNLSSQGGRIKGMDFSQMGKLDGICVLTPSSAAPQAVRR